MKKRDHTEWGTWFACIGIASVIIWLVLSCGQNAQAKRVAIAQYIDHPGLDAARKGFLAEMTALGFKDGVDVRYDYLNAEGDNIAMQNIALKISSRTYDLVLTLATPISQAVKRKLAGKNVPVIYGVITDPVSAGLVESMEHPGDNNTASSDRWPYFDQMKLIRDALPGRTKVGILLNPGEVNTQFAIREVRRAADSLGLQVVESPIYSINDVPEALGAIARKIHVLYVISDNTAMAAAPSIIRLGKRYGIPTVAGDPETFKAGALLGLGVSYYDLGKETAKLAEKILNKKAKAGDLPVAVAKNAVVMVNLKVANELSITIPERILAKARQVIE